MKNNIDELIVKYLAQEANAGEREKVDLWRCQSIENECYFNDYLKLWEASSAAKNKMVFDTDSAWQNVKTKIQANQTHPPRVSYKNYWMAAASIVLISMFTFILVKPSKHKELAIVSENFGDTLRKVLLPDGSEVVLQKGTIRYSDSFDKNSRKVILTGKAFFSVKKDSKHPFVVQSGNTTITVLGTSFDVTSNDSSSHVSVKTGKVHFETPGGATTLIAGNAAFYHVAKKELQRIEKADANDFAYITGRIEFKNHSVKEALKFVSSYYKVNVKVATYRVNDCKISATFENDSLENVLAVIAYTLGLKVEENKDGFLLTGKGCQP